MQRSGQTGAEFRRRTRGRVGALACAALVLTLGCSLHQSPRPGVIPDDLRPPVAVVQRFQAAVLEIMKEADALGYAGRLKILAPVARDCFDIHSMARRSLGAQWEKLDEAQQRTWFETFERFHISALAAERDTYSGQSFVTLSAERVSDIEVRVHSQTDYPGRQVDLYTDYLLFEHSQRGWLIVDVFRPPTISEVAMRRSEYEATLAKDGFAKLLADMEARIARNAQS